MTPFGTRLRTAMAALGPLCAGIDPHRGLVESWGLTYDLPGVERFALTCVAAFGGQVALVKPQSAFFEVFGSGGVALLERVLGDLRDVDTLSLLDVKRGDIGSTMDAYAASYLADEAPVRADAITASPYLGYESLRPALDLASANGRGVFVLALTSNPEGASVQHARSGDATVAQAVVAGVRADNAEEAAAGALGSVGLVVGATVGSAVTDLGLDLAGANAPILAPGYGAQGAGPAEIAALFGTAAANVLPSASRSILAAGPTVAGLRRAVVAEQRRLAGVAAAAGPP